MITEYIEKIDDNKRPDFLSSTVEFINIVSKDKYKDNYIQYNPSRSYDLLNIITNVESTYTIKPKHVETINLLKNDIEQNMELEYYCEILKKIKSEIKYY
jgi:hypothetical protein